MAVHPHRGPRRFAPATQTGAQLLLAAGLVLQPLMPAARATPELVLLLRHGHKSGEAGNFNLSSQGFERAIALATLLPRCFGRPDQIITFEFNPTSSKNARSYQTAVPLGVATGVNISLALGSSDNSFRSGRHILSDPGFDGRRLVLFWEHRRLPQLAAGLDWPAMKPIADDDFDQLIVLHYRPPLSRPQVRLYSQSALLDGRQRCEPLPPPRHGQAAGPWPPEARQPLANPVPSPERRPSTRDLPGPAS